MNQYREGKVKRTPSRRVKQNLKPYAYKQWEHHGHLFIEVSGVTACLLHNESASCVV